MACSRPWSGRVHTIEAKECEEQRDKNAKIQFSPFSRSLSIQLLMTSMVVGLLHVEGLHPTGHLKVGPWTLHKYVEN
jgi:hypothetical protein